MQLPSRHSGIIQSLSYATANIAGSVLSAISLIVLSRALGPANFGAFSVAFSLTQITARLADLGLSVALQKFIAQNYHNHADVVAAAVTWATRLKAFAALIALLVGFVFGPVMGTKLFGLTDPRFATIGIVMAAIIIFYEYVVLINQSLHQFRIAALLNAAQAGLKLLFGVIVLFLVVPPALHSYFWYGIVPIIPAIYGYVRIPHKYRRVVAIPSTVTHTLMQTAKFSYIAAIAITVADQLDVLMVKSMMNEFQTGLYAAASRISLMFTMFAMSVGTVLYTRVARYKQHHLMVFYKKSLLASLLLVLSTPLLLLMAPFLLYISAGPAYLEALPIVRLLLIATTITMATVPLIAPFYSLEYPSYFMFSGLLQIIILVSANLLLIPHFGIVGAAWAKIIMRTIVLLYTVVTSYGAVKAHYET